MRAMIRAGRIGRHWYITSEYFSIGSYIKEPSVDRAKGRRWPTLRGTWLPSIDRQCWGVAINWLCIRVRIGK